MERVCFGPDDATLLSSSPDGTSRIWDAADGTERQVLPHPNHVNGLAVSPDGKWVVTGCNDAVVRVWDFNTGLLDKTRLAVLADALEEAGCDNQDILSHCRDPGQHVRGCHALDLLLGKQ